ncbi:unnamed protein product [Gongylonema pulchrum]|uniref:C-type lectin domain-containing protein n=1 Tax=Gongylonema pulchrum TaxID=637853 RepID=A0A183D7J9_9BILA|nr:unnamed protein product [Gongylonema pulchrum]
MNAAPYWIGIHKINGSWMAPSQDRAAAASHGYRHFGHEPAKFTNWGPLQPDGCCGFNMTCVLVDFDNLFALWNDAGCEHAWTPYTGVVCQRYGDQPVFPF